MRNPFRTPLPLSYNPYPNDIKADTNSTVHSNTVYLDDVVYPDAVAESDSASNFGDLQVQPSYDDSIDPAGIRRELIFTPGIVNGYEFVTQENGQTDVAVPEDFGGIPGTVSLNVFHGPVSGNAMDEWQVGARTQLESTPPQYTGPVTGFPDADYATQLAYATYQQQLADYSSAVNTDAMVAAI